MPLLTLCAAFVQFFQSSSTTLSIYRSSSSFVSFVSPIELFIRDADTVFYGTKFLRVLCIAVAVYPLLFVIIAVFQAVGEGAKPFLLSLLHKGSLDIVLFFVIRKVFGSEYILWATPAMSAVALSVGVILVLRLFKTLHLKKRL